MGSRGRLSPPLGGPTLLGDFPSFSYADQLENRQEKRNRTIQSCTECRRRKTKCDREFPCGPCKARGAKAKDACEEYQKPAPEGLTGYTHLRDFDTLVNRVYELECYVSAMHRGELPDRSENAGASYGGLPVSIPGPSGLGINNTVAGSSALGLASGSRSVRFSTGIEEQTNTSRGYAPEGTMDPNFGRHRLDSVGFETSGFSGNMQEEDSLNNRRTIPDTGPRNDAFGYDPSRFLSAAQPSNLSVPASNARSSSSQAESRLPHTAIPLSTAGWRHPDHRSGSRVGSQSEPASKAPSLTEHDAALLLEDMVYDRNVMRDGNAGLSGMTKDSRSTPLNLSTEISIATVSDGHNGPEELISIPGLECLPPLALAQFLLNHFISDFRCLHVPTFMQQIADFHQHVPLAGRLTAGQASFLPLYTACLCASLHLMSDDVLQSVGYSQSERTAALADWSEVLEMAMLKIDWAGSPKMDSLQAFIIIGPYWSSVNRSESHLAQLGTAIKVAMNLGLSRLGPEMSSTATFAQVQHHFGRRWAAARDREVGRRIWWSLVDLDWHASLEHRFDYIASIDRNTCAEPANVTDESLVGHGPIVAESSSVHTNMSFFLNRLQFLHPIRDFVRSVVAAGKLRYDLVISAQENFISVIEEMSPFYRLNADFDMDPSQWATDALMLQRLSIEKHLINTHGHYQILRLHRFYLNMAYRSHKYAFSKDVTLRSARFLIRTNFSTTPANTLLRYWPQAQGVLSATIVILMNLCHAGRFEVDDLAVLVRQGISSLRQLRGSTATSRSADLLQRLYDAEMDSKKSVPARESFRDYALGKRKREVEEESSKFGGLLKRVLSTPQVQQARLEQDTTSLIQKNIGSYDPNMAFDPFVFGNQEADISADHFDWSTLLMNDNSFHDDHQFMELLRWTNPEIGEPEAQS